VIPLKIMIVDDHADMRKVLKSILVSTLTSELEIVQCATGEEAVLGYSSHWPDCVLMDIDLKSMTGFEVMKKIYELDVNAKIIMVTSYDTSIFRKKAKELHAQAFVSKDCLTEITSAIRSLNLNS